MSYILDGLRKAEKERQLESVPDLQTVHAPYPGKNKSGKKSSLYLSGIFFFMLVVLGAALRFYSGDKVPSSSGVAELNSPVTSPGSEVSESRHPPAPAEPLPVLSEKNIPAASPAPAPQLLLPFREELQEGLRSQLPEIRYAGHTYADNPQHRLIIINNRIMKEGGRIEGNLKLVEITWEGIVLDFQGTRFRMNTVQN